MMLQWPFPYGVKFSSEVHMQGDDPNLSMGTFSLLKEFKTWHLQYMKVPGQHMLNYMHHVTRNLIAGVQISYVVSTSPSNYLQLLSVPAFPKLA